MPKDPGTKYKHSKASHYLLLVVFLSFNLCQLLYGIYLMINLQKQDISKKSRKIRYARPKLSWDINWKFLQVSK